MSKISFIIMLPFYYIKDLTFYNQYENMVLSISIRESDNMPSILEKIY